MTATSSLGPPLDCVFSLSIMFVLYIVYGWSGGVCVGCYYRSVYCGLMVAYFMRDYYDYDYDDGDDYYMVIKNKALFRRLPPRV